MRTKFRWPVYDKDGKIAFTVETWNRGIAGLNMAHMKAKFRLLDKYNHIPEYAIGNPREVKS